MCVCCAHAQTGSGAVEPHMLISAGTLPVFCRGYRGGLGGCRDAYDFAGEPSQTDAYGNTVRMATLK